MEQFGGGGVVLRQGEEDEGISVIGFGALLDFHRLRRDVC
jgi:hypothetical protein